ncbi:frataxin, mitochondrial [Parasteatoda tepidariorum]|uniref:frataxin, mitochondrial n=1 Tax=Parasteatoda tepidariorum TaxID=114398 RepID=UPI0039BC4DC2
MQNKISIPVIANFCYNITKMKSFSINSSVKFEQIAEETLQNLCESFENVLEKSNLVEWDVNYSNGVLTVTLNHHGSYVLNKQSPNKQIWLSSPISGPKRYDYIDEKWIYKRDGISLCRILSEEMSNILQEEINFEDCL